MGCILISKTKAEKTGIQTFTSKMNLIKGKNNAFIFAPLTFRTKKLKKIFKKHQSKLVVIFEEPLENERET